MASTYPGNSDDLDELELPPIAMQSGGRGKAPSAGSSRAITPARARPLTAPSSRATGAASRRSGGLPWMASASDERPLFSSYIPAPIRKHSRDLKAIGYFACGVVTLLSLYFRSGSIGLGSFLHALLGWGAPAMGVLLILVGIITASGTASGPSLHLRLGSGMLLTGFLTFAGLLNNHTRGQIGDGGDIGNHLAALFLRAMDSVTGDGAAYPCAQTLLLAFNLGGFVLATDRPLMDWARILVAGFRSLLRAFGQFLRRCSPPPSSGFNPPAVSENARTRRSRSGAVAPVPDLATPAPLGGTGGFSRAGSSRSPSPALSPLNGLDALDTETESTPRPTVMHVDPVTSVDRPRRKVTEAFTAALDLFLPPAPVEDFLPADEETKSDGLDSGAHHPAPVGSEEFPPIQGGRAEQMEDWARAESHEGPSDPEAGGGFDAGTEDEALLVGEPEDEEGNGAAFSSESRGPGIGPGSDRTAESPPKIFTPNDLPPSALLNLTPPPTRKSQDEAQATVMTLERTLQEFKVDARVVEIAEGPTLTRYEIQLAPGILVKKILSLADNIAMALAAIDVRVEAPIPGKSAIGVEIPRRNPGVVGLRELVETREFRGASPLTFALGKDVTGAPQYADLARMPHILIAGSTGSGKSACLNTLITSILFKASPDEVQFVMIDPKRVELSLYDGIPHLCHQIVRDSRKAPQALGRAMAEMDRRYILLQNAHTRNIAGYNAKVEEPQQKLPFIVVVIDELADLMMTSGAETEHAITRLAQLARAVGIHLVVATQRPSVDIVTGKIKANVSSRIAFAVSSGVDSRTILDCMGAERLIGRGDMLFMPIDASKPRRIQGAYIGESELEKVVEFWRSKGRPDYSLERTPIPDAEPQPTGDAEDELYSEAVRVVLTAGQASTSMIQRRLKIGYNRAATLIELMEEHGVVGPQDGVRPREVLISRDSWELAQAD